MERTLSHLTRRCLSVGFALTAMLLAACGNNNEPNNTPNNTSVEDLCAEVTCERGVCDAASGECSNATDCGGEDASCLQGYSCVNDLCRADIPCNANGSCDRGQCVDGACLDPEMCSANEDCVEGSFCDNGSCEPDPCSTTSCEDGGVCITGTGACENPETCAADRDCLTGFACIEGACLDDASYCATLECERGECSFEERECVSAEDCGGDDNLCLDGEYCGADNTCQPNICDTINQTCPRGECNPSNGECQNPTTCAAADDCLDGYWCIADSCVLPEDACSQESCAGNQRCEYDDASLATTCSENAEEGCNSAIDCLDDRVCRSGVCEDAPMCAPDQFEPNNVDGEETAFLDVTDTGRINQLTLCDGDVDRFGYDIAEDPEETGLLLVNLELNPEDIGLGKVKVSVLNGPGFLVSEGTNEDDDGNLTGFVRLEDVVVTDIDMGVYTVIVEQEGQLNPAGLRYSIQIDLADPDILNACENPPLLAEGMAVAGTFMSAQSAGLTSTCADAGGTSPEVLYRLDVKNPVYATFLGQGAANFSISVRQACSIDATELPGACAAEAGAGGIEQLGVALDPGTYYVVLQAEDSNGGNYVLSYTTQEITCDPDAAKMCVDGDTAQECNDTLTGVRQIACEFGCDPMINGCTTKIGDVCENPIIVDPAVGYAADIERDTYNNSYDPGANSCVPDNSSSQDTDGPDTVFQVTVPDGKVLSMTVEGIGADDTTIYLVDDCADVANSCITGVNQYASTSDDETLFWRNDTGMDQTLFAIMDVEDESFLSDPFVQIEVQDFVCTPGSAVCGTANRESLICNDIGTGYTLSIECGEGNCDPGTGRCATAVRDTCGGAEVLTPGVTATGTIDALADDYSDDCGISTAQTTGADATFVLQNVQAGDRISVVTDDDFDSLVYIAQDCDLTDNSLGACLAGADDDTGTTSTEELDYLAPTTGDYYIVLDVADTGISTGSFSVTATVASPTCTPGDFLGCNAAGTGVTVCDAQGFEIEVPCSSSQCDSTTNTCINPDGDTCFEAIAVTGTMGQLTGTFDASTNSIQIDEPTGNCLLDDTDLTDGDEYIYAVDLQPGDLLTADFKSSYSSSRFYLQETCGDNNSCYGQYDTSGDNLIQYYANNAQTVYMVVDSTSTLTSSTGWTIDWKIEQGFSCAPSMSNCIDPNTVRSCDSTGMSFTDTTCATGCAGLGCADDPVLTDTCSVNVPDLGAGASIIVDLSDHTNTQDPESCADGDGADTFFQVTAQAGDLIEVVADGSAAGEIPSAYIFTDCADVDNSCVLGGEGTSSSPLQLVYQAPAAGVYYIGFDSTISSYDEPHLYTVRTLPPQCNDQTPPMCDQNGTDLLYCVNGLFQSYTCDGTCTAGACDTPTGDLCFDAIPLTSTTSPVVADWSGQTDQVNIGGRIQGNCVFDDADAPDGAETVYSIDLAQGEVLDLTLDTSESNAVLYVLNDCTSDGNACVANDPTEGTTSQDRRVTFAAPATGTYYVVVDRTDTFDSNGYTLTWSVDANLTCAPGQYACLDANTLGLCNEAGTALAQTYACPSGCAGSICTPDFTTWDSCGTAPVLTEGIFTVASVDQFTNSFNATSSGCTGTDGDGNDFFFQVDLQPNEILDASALSLGGEVPTIAIFTDCADPELTCLDGDEGTSSIPATATYQAGNSPETVYVIVDSDFSGNDEAFAVQIEKQTPDCMPGQFMNRCASDNLAYEYCDDRGFIQRYECNDDNMDGVACTMGRCDEPVGDLCEDPFEVLPDASGNFTMMGVLADAASDTDLATGNQCTGSLTRGPDPVYGLNVVAGQTVTVDLVSTEATPEDLAVYITTDCDTLPNSCVAGADTQGGSTTPETATYMANQDGRIYIVVDSYYAGSQGAYQLDVTVQ